MVLAHRHQTDARPSIQPRGQTDAKKTWGTQYARDTTFLVSCTVTPARQAQDFQLHSQRTHEI